jgi:hypothetical protein
MTNFLAGVTVPSGYMLGLLNSRLLDWRIRITSTNNYISAREVENLPVPRPGAHERGRLVRRWVRDRWTAYLLPELLRDSPASITGSLALLRAALPGNAISARDAYIPPMIESLAHRIEEGRAPDAAAHLLDALILLLFRVEQFVSVLEGGKE